MCVFLCNLISVSLTLQTFDFLVSKVNDDGSFRVAVFTPELSHYVKHPNLSLRVRDLVRVRRNTGLTLQCWDVFGGVNQVSLTTFMHLLYLDFASKVYHGSFSPALTLSSNLLPADLYCLSNPAWCPKPITQLP